MTQEQEQADESPAKIVVLSVDLMDRSKISAALPHATLVRSLDAAIERSADADVVIVDLNRVEDMERLRDIGTTGCRVFAFGSHVDEDTLAAAAATGAEAMPRSVFFRRLGAGVFAG